jgi:hypothetical protein
MKIRPGEASRLSGPSTERGAARSDLLPPPSGNLGVWASARQPFTAADAWRVNSADFGPLPEARARLPFRPESSDPVAKEQCRMRRIGRFPLPPGCDCSRLTMAGCVTTTLEIRSPTELCYAFRRLPSREAPRSVPCTVALQAECNSGRRVGQEIGDWAVGMLFLCVNCCGGVWKTRLGLVEATAWARGRWALPLNITGPAGFQGPVLGL